MDLALTQTETHLQSALDVLLERHAGAAHAKELGSAAAADTELGAQLEEGGFLDLFHEDDAGPSAAGLITEWVAAAAGVLPIGARSLVLPALGLSAPALTTIADRSDLAAVRFAEAADALLLIDGTEATLLSRGEWTAEPLASKYGYPMARVVEVGTGTPVDANAAAAARRWWQVALGAEITGTAQAALDLTVRYVKEREQFGRPIGGFQAVQHRLAECAVRVEGTRWLVREAIGLGAPAGPAAAAAVAAAQTAQLIMRETHQLTGAMGFTREYDLHVWSLRLAALRVEAGGLSRHAEELVAARWG